MSQTFYSNGKLLITGEYAVLDGATALAIPTSYGQSLQVADGEGDEIHWRSYDNTGKIWFEENFNLKNLRGKSTSDKTASELTEILLAAKQLNPLFLSVGKGYSVTTQMNFPRKWGLGSSSTLINNIAQWAQVNAYVLLAKSFGGSGYDIAAAQNDTPLYYRLDNGMPNLLPVSLPWRFKERLFFVYLNAKQDSREGILRYRKSPLDRLALDRISQISLLIGECCDLGEFEELLAEHEKIISQSIQLPTVKSRYFPHYPHTIKSLGAWGGDFVLVVGDEEKKDYFREKGFTTIIPFPEMIKG